MLSTAASWPPLGALKWHDSTDPTSRNVKTKKREEREGIWAGSWQSIVDQEKEKEARWRRMEEGYREKEGMKRGRKGGRERTRASERERPVCFQWCCTGDRIVRTVLSSLDGSGLGPLRQTSSVARGRGIRGQVYTVPKSQSADIVISSAPRRPRLSRITIANRRVV